MSSEKNNRDAYSPFLKLVLEIESADTGKPDIEN
jgi:hypothetical protein